MLLVLAMPKSCGDGSGAVLSAAPISVPLTSSDVLSSHNVVSKLPKPLGNLATRLKSSCK